MKFDVELDENIKYGTNIKNINLFKLSFKNE